MTYPGMGSRDFRRNALRGSCTAALFHCQPYSSLQTNPTPCRPGNDHGDAGTYRWRGTSILAVGEGPLDDLKRRRQADDIPETQFNAGPRHLAAGLLP